MFISEKLSLNKDSSPPMKYYDSYLVDRKSLTDEQMMLVTGFGMYFTALQKYATVDDKVSVQYISKYYSYFCSHYKPESLLEDARINFKLAASGSNPFMNKALGESSCNNDYLDDLEQ